MTTQRPTKQSKESSKHVLLQRIKRGSCGTGTPVQEEGSSIGRKTGILPPRRYILIDRGIMKKIRNNNTIEPRISSLVVTFTPEGKWRLRSIIVPD